MRRIQVCLSTIFFLVSSINSCHCHCHFVPTLSTWRRRRSSYAIPPQVVCLALRVDTIVRTPKLIPEIVCLFFSNVRASSSNESYAQSYSTWSD
uniref:Putative secreted protein n=1 Tax=Anopheles darlingi TaxID=43151 RepID=A0A2M4DE65_ANODA